jgi:hypothetical protein
MSFERLSVSGSLAYGALGALVGGPCFIAIRVLLGSDGNGLACLLGIAIGSAVAAHVAVKVSIGNAWEKLRQERGPSDAQKPFAKPSSPRTDA